MMHDKVCELCKHQKIVYSPIYHARIRGCELDNKNVGCCFIPIDSDKLDPTYYEELDDRHEWDDLTSGDALVVLKRRSSDRDSRIEALGVLIRNDDNEMHYLSKSELKYNLEILTGRHMYDKEFKANTVDSLMIMLEQTYKRISRRYD